MVSIETYHNPAIEDSPEAESSKSEAFTHEQLAEISDLYIQEYPRMVRTAMKYRVRDPEATAQTAFAKALKNWNKFRDQGSSRGAWLGVITVNTAINELRKKKSGVELPGSDMFVYEDRADAKSLSDFEQIEEEMYMDPIEARIRELLSDEFYDVFNKVAMEGKQYDEVGDELGIPRATVGSRYFRARKKLAQDPELRELLGRE